ncbi:MAG: ParB/RepB/Spo0J family partition protein [Clostridia bacterium]|nr:ParB/RepB/Spo0J family partition protein [Clostridia bacterium]
MTKSRLGKGLSALIPANAELLSAEEPATEIEIKKIKPNAYQPRQHFNEEKLEEVTNSIREHGVVQPIVVRALPGGLYELVVGERRLRASQKLQLKKIPAVVKELTDQQMIEIALIENIQRHDLNPVEEAAAYKRLLEEFKLTQEQVASRVGKSRPLIANMLRLLNLPPEVLALLARGELTVGHVRPLLSLAEKEEQITVARHMLEEALSVRQAEKYVQEAVEGRRAGHSSRKQKADKAPKLPPDIAELEERLRSMCQTKVRINYTEGKGRIEIEYYSDDDLDRIFNLFNAQNLE